MSFDEEKEINLDEVKVITEQVKKRGHLQQLFWDSAQYIKKYGWVKEMYYIEDGAVCIMGAFMRVLKVDEENEFVDNAANYLSDNFLPNQESVPTWNDKKERTIEEVIFLLEKAANS